MKAVIGVVVYAAGSWAFLQWCGGITSGGIAIMAVLGVIGAAGIVRANRQLQVEQAQMDTARHLATLAKSKNA